MRRALYGLLILTMALGSPGSAVGQDAAGPSHATLAVEASLRLTRLVGQSGVLLGGVGLLTTGGKFSIGAGGWVHPGDSDVGEGSSGAAFRLRTAYGGVVANYRITQVDRGTLTARALLGAGTARLVLAVAGTETDADNFGVFEPEIAIAWPLRPGLDAGGGLSHRFVFGLDNLPAVAGSDLGGLALRLSIAYHGF